MPGRFAWKFTPDSFRMQVGYAGITWSGVCSGFALGGTPGFVPGFAPGLLLGVFRGVFRGFCSGGLLRMPH
jgi:hypothetical protein